MSIVLLFVSFFFACAGAWIFFDGYFAATTQTEEFYAAVSGMAWAVLPYLIAKTLADMVAIRQRHLQLEQASQLNYIMVEQIQAAEEAMRREKAAAVKAANPVPGSVPAAPQPRPRPATPAIVPDATLPDERLPDDADEREDN